jgi:hypothetical protein
MAIRFNTSQGGGFETYEAGTYTLKIESVTQGTSKAGNPQLTVKCTFVGGRYDGKTITVWYSLTPQSFWKIQLLIEATACNHTVVGEDAQGQPIIEFDEQDLVGLIFDADVTIEDYQGKKNNRVNKERASELLNDAQPEQAAPAQATSTPAPAQQAAPTQPQTTAATMQRRPRTVGQSS